MTGAVSARGLFRAMGHQVKNERLREKHDFYPTPPEPTEAFLRAEGERLAQFPDIWEPAVGDGAMAKVMRAHGYRVHASDLIDRGCSALIRDFYNFDQPMSRAIVTNPPFQECNWKSGKGRWIYHAIETLGVEYMALLLNWNWPAAAGLGGLWAKHPPARVYLMRWKVDFTGDGSPPQLNGWFVWDKAARVGTPEFLMLDRPRHHVSQGAFELNKEATPC